MSNPGHTNHDYVSPPPRDLLADLAAALGVAKVTPDKGVFTHTFIVRHSGRVFVLAAPYRKKTGRSQVEVWVLGEIEGKAYHPTYLQPRPHARLTRTP